ncbi:MAG TPA: mechanosensitive ion channel protein MscS [Flavobacteriales bacterium]|jgi:small conductance mechanosensitive channel|nr:mechanosensitive ion channel protein MscS [Flavobacteriales bacterium]
MELDINWKSAIIVLTILVCTILITRLVRWLISNSFVSASDRIRVDPTRYRFFKNAASFIVWLIALGSIVLLVPELKALAITLFAGAGILVAFAGLAAQQAFSNIVSGIFIVIFKPFRVGDMIKVGTLNYGIVEDITLRHTIINNFENKRIIIPNSVISSETIVNDSIEDSKICRWIEVGISYDSDMDRAIEIIQEESIKHPFCIDNRTPEEKEEDNPQVRVRILGFGDSSVNLRAYVWCSESLQSIRMHSDINRSIKNRFDAEGIEIPFPYRTIVYKKDLPPNS